MTTEAPDTREQAYMIEPNSGSGVEYLPKLDLGATIHPSGYIPDPGLVDAVNVSLLLKQPLLLTGEPGTGKSQLAYSIAWQLALASPLVFETKSTSVSKDLFYTFDNLARFHANSNQADDISPNKFISYNALGKAILMTKPWEEAVLIAPAIERYDSPMRRVVLIDEVDKAPRDFPNDILNELDRLYFRIAELDGIEVQAAESLRPIVIITSNSEKSLPDAFLRRCIFYHLPFPDEARLESIVSQRISALQSDSPLLQDMLDFFGRLRDESLGLRKRPGTAELLNWANVLVALGLDLEQGIKSQAEVAMKTLSNLAKHPEDQDRVYDEFKAWVHA